jgi:hypothetical protein
MNEDRARAFDNLASRCTVEEINGYIQATMDTLADKTLSRSDRELWLEDLERWITHYRMAVANPAGRGGLK